MPLFDYRCSNTECKHHAEPFEEFVNHLDEEVYCPLCKFSLAERIAFSIELTAPMSPKYVDMHRKFELIRKKMNGQIPWRKCSESQSD
jgi:hypothetical protein